MYRLFGKRVLDITIVLLSVFTLGVVIFIIAVLIKCFDPGPVIFRQQRVGQGGKPFSFLKFRSMPVNTGDMPSDEISALKLTWIGKLIRRTNIDELPQLFNILKGDMSIVGPRPPISSQHELIAIRKENGALACRPGLTGLAQINAFDGMSVAEKAAYDGDYAEHITFIRDIKIICLTFKYLLKSPPVY